MKQIHDRVDRRLDRCPNVEESGTTIERRMNGICLEVFHTFANRRPRVRELVTFQVCP